MQILGGYGKLSPNGERVLSSGLGSVKIWDSGSGEELVQLVASSNKEWVAITPKGFFAASEYGHNLLNIVRGLESYSIDQFYDWLSRPDLVKEKLAGDPNKKVKKTAAKFNLGMILEAGPPPHVKIISPKKNRLIQSDRVKVKVEITGRGKGGIGRIEFRVNKVNKGNIYRSSNGVVSISMELELASENNEIEVVAYNKRGLVNPKLNAAQFKEATIKSGG